MNENIILKPIEGTEKKEVSSAEDLRKEMASLLGMTDKATKEAIDKAVNDINSTYNKYKEKAAAEKNNTNIQEWDNFAKALLSKLNSVSSLEEAQKIIDEDYNNSKQEHNAKYETQMAMIQSQVGTFSINGQEYKLLQSGGGIQKLYIEAV